MKAVEISAFGKPDVLRLGERPDPVAGAGELLIRVGASGVNRPATQPPNQSENTALMPWMMTPPVPKSSTGESLVIGW